MNIQALLTNNRMQLTNAEAELTSVKPIAVNIQSEAKNVGKSALNSRECFVGWVTLSLTHAVKGFDALRLCLIQLRLNEGYLLINLAVKELTRKSGFRLRSTRDCLVR